MVSVVLLRPSIWMDMGQREKGHSEWVIDGVPGVFNMGPLWLHVETLSSTLCSSFYIEFKNQILCLF